VLIVEAIRTMPASSSTWRRTGFKVLVSSGADALARRGFQPTAVSLVFFRLAGWF
jgi:hypothetical protein